MACLMRTLSLFTLFALVYLTAAVPHEVWLSDQTHTQGITETSPRGTHGGRIYIYDSRDIEKRVPVDNPTILDVSAHLFPDANERTYGHVSRLHGIRPSPDSKFMALNFVASGHLGIVDGETKKPVCLFQTTKTSTGRQNHMSFWDTTGDYLAIANQNGRMLERIDVQRTRRRRRVVGFTFNAEASVDLVGGPNRILQQPVSVDMDPNDGIACNVSGVVHDNQTLYTPRGTLKQQTSLRPLNNLICPTVTTTNHIFATLGGGGMFVFDLLTTPMRIVAEYDVNLYRSAGCGGVEFGGYMHMNTGSPRANASEFTFYRFRLGDYLRAPGFNPDVNQPAPIAVWADPDNGKVAGTDLPLGKNRDAHGATIVRRNSRNLLYAFDRIRNNIEVFRLCKPWNVFTHTRVVSMESSGVCGTTLGATTSNDPTPDLSSTSPLGTQVYVPLRGPFPVTIAHAASGSCPGLGIITVNAKGIPRLAYAFPTTQLNFGGTENLSDPHDATVRVKSSRRF